MNPDSAIIEWAEREYGIDWNNIPTGEQNGLRRRYNEMFPVLQVVLKTPLERILSMLVDTLEYEPILHSMNAGHALKKACKFIRTVQAIDLLATRDGKVKVVESGRDCDGVEYDGRVHIIDATIDAFETLDNEIGEWADGPYHLSITGMDEDVEYTTRDLVMEAHEDGHRHSIVSRFP